MTELTVARLSIQTDPAPVPPGMPMDSECCESACERCVWTVYQEDKLEYERRYAEWLIRHPEHAPYI
ncbi:MAG: oxidoreductase-like domain-containing protein [Pseudomonadota bacterium]